MTNRETPPILDRLQQLGIALGLVGIIGCVIAALGDWPEFVKSYMFGYIFWICFTLGCFGFMLLQNMVRANWAFPVQRLFEAGSTTLPLMFVLFLPIIVGMKVLYPWAQPEVVSVDAVVAHKALLMNWFGVPGGGFVARTLFYFALWSLIAFLMNRSSYRQDVNGDPNEAQYRSNVSAPAFVFFVLTLTLAFTDWVMSIDKHWYSTIFGLWFFDACGLSALPLMTILLTQAKSRPYTDLVVTERVRKDTGNMLIMLVMVWGYFSLSQFLIIWSGNLPEEIGYYLTRNSGALLYVGGFRIIFQFFVPFVLLLSGRNKRGTGSLAAIAVWLLIMRVIDLYWTVVPAYRPVGVVHWQDLAALLGIGGVWLTWFVWQAKQHPLLPQYSPAGQLEAIEA